MLVTVMDFIARKVIDFVGAYFLPYKRKMILDRHWWFNCWSWF